MDFAELLSLAKSGDQAAIETLFEMYKPMIQREATTSGVFDEDCYQELCCVFLQCIDHFQL